MRRLTCLAMMLTVGLPFTVATPVASATARTPAKSGYTVIPAYRGLSFHLHSSHGYEVAVQTLGRDRIAIEAASQGAYVEYIIPAHNSDEGIEANIGSLGRIEMKFDPSGPLERSTEPQGDCKGRRERFQRGTFRGNFRFRGERDFTSASAGRAPGVFSHSFREVCKGEDAGRNNDPELQPTLIAHFNASVRSLAVDVFLEEGSATFQARIVERRPSFKVERALVQGAGPGSYVLAPDGAVTLMPPLPFTGTVTYRPPSMGGEAWSGSLSAPFPGLGVISLAGPSFRVTDKRVE